MAAGMRGLEMSPLAHFTTLLTLLTRITAADAASNPAPLVYPSRLTSLQPRTEISDACNLSVLTQGSPRHIALAIDYSTSTLHTDPHSYRTDGARAVVLQLSPEDDLVAVVNFGGEGPARIAYPLGSPKGAIDVLNERDTVRKGSFVGSGVEGGCGQVEGENGAQVIVFSDGEDESDELTRRTAEAVERCNSNGVVVHLAALGGGEDANKVVRKAIERDGGVIRGVSEPEEYCEFLQTVFGRDTVGLADEPDDGQSHVDADDPTEKKPEGDDDKLGKDKDKHEDNDLVVIVTGNDSDAEFSVTSGSDGQAMEFSGNKEAGPMTTDDGQDDTVQPGPLSGSAMSVPAGSNASFPFDINRGERIILAVETNTTGKPMQVTVSNAEDGTELISTETDEQGHAVIGSDVMAADMRTLITIKPPASDNDGAAEVHMVNVEVEAEEVEAEDEPADGTPLAFTEAPMVVPPTPSTSSPLPSSLVPSTSLTGYGETSRSSSSTSSTPAAPRSSSASAVASPTATSTSSPPLSSHSSTAAPTLTPASTTPGDWTWPAPSHPDPKSDDGRNTMQSQCTPSAAPPTSPTSTSSAAPSSGTAAPKQAPCGAPAEEDGASCGSGDEERLPEDGCAELPDRPGSCGNDEDTSPVAPVAPNDCGEEAGDGCEGGDEGGDGAEGQGGEADLAAQGEDQESSASGSKAGLVLMVGGGYGRV
ncbi:hypothetical protein BDY21DRAFT_374659 [Lineolata rhizophorae]|uniref:VWFA domain-containing protein n=1 Tax=Lineolata rhizophorae TaxID=578093 RepID=A0A6A6NPH1_9PEZI|nr:hypothetical protein BDY21DRAFT_374659 [Lineolata rhizophorae]